MSLATQNLMSSAPQALKWSTCSQTQCLRFRFQIKAPRDFKAHYTWYSMERIVNPVEENLDGNNIMRIWKDYTTKDAIVIVKKPVKTIKPETISSCGGNCFQMLCVTSQDLWQSSSRKLWKRLWKWQKKIGWWLWRVSEYGSWRNSRANRHHTRGIIRRWLSASEPVPDNGEDVHEAVPEKKTNKKLTLDKSQKGSDFSRLLLHSFMTWMISPMIWALKWMVGGFSLYRNILREMKSEVRQKLWYISIVTLSVPGPPCCPFHLLSLFGLCHSWDSKTNLPLQPTQHGNGKDEDLYDDLFPLNEQ